MRAEEFSVLDGELLEGEPLVSHKILTGAWDAGRGTRNTSLNDCQFTNDQFINDQSAELPTCRNYGSAEASPSSEQKFEIAENFVASPLVGDGCFEV